MTDNPYSSPNSTEAQQPATIAAASDSSSSDYTYKSLGGLCQGIGWALAGFVIFSAAAVVVVMINTASGDPVAVDATAGVLPSQRPELHEYLMAFVYGSSACMIANIIMIPLFSYRANANLRAMGVKGMLHGPELSSVYWFVPILNLFRPYQALKEVFVESHIAGDDNLPRPNTSIVSLYWGCWIFYHIANRVSKHLVRLGNDQSVFYLMVMLFSFVSVTAAAIFLFSTLRVINTKQADMHGGIVEI